MVRRPKILESMYRDFATEDELAEIERLYKIGQKGSAEAKMLRAVREKWLDLWKLAYPRQQEKNNYSLVHPLVFE